MAALPPAIKWRPSTARNGNEFFRSLQSPALPCTTNLGAYFCHQALEVFQIVIRHVISQNTLRLRQNLAKNGVQ